VTACGGRGLAILDCRPRLNAVVNQFTGGGYESIANYENCTFEFLGIPNIHRVRECYQTMVESYQRGRPHGYRQWGALTLQLIHGARLACQKLSDNEAVLVHCTDGWDRTAQVVGLVQVLLDPFSRTFDGFRQLVQKDWCDAGHMFGLRCCHAPHGALDQSAPIFAQFVDAVYQLMVIQRDAFEFNEQLLAYLLFHSYSQLYGDFLGDCYRDRVELQRPPSIWATFDDPGFRAKFLNTSFAQLDGEIVADVIKYKLSKIICANPTFACSPAVPLRADPPAVDSEWTNVPTHSLIPRNDAAEPLPMDEADELASVRREGFDDLPELPDDAFDDAPLEAFSVDVV
jgi:hypothetical protein